jgi:hypothetical protein
MSKPRGKERSQVKTTKQPLKVKASDDLSPRAIFILSATKEEYNHFTSALCPCPHLRKRIKPLWWTKELWELENTPISVFRLPTHHDWEEYPKLMTYLWMKCNDFLMFNQYGRLITGSWKVHETRPLNPPLPPAV